MAELGMDEFLEHSGTERGGKFLSGWRDKDKGGKGYVNTWMHRRASMLAIWRHAIPRIDVVEDKETGDSKRVIRFAQWGCWENEEILKVQGRRDRDTGIRQAPPESCGVCKMIEHIHSRVASGDLSWVEPVFKFDVGDAKPTILHAAGLYNGFSNDKLTKAELDEMKEHDIFPRHAWKENWRASLNYVFRVVDNAAPKLGTQIAVESNLLGDKVKTLIRDTMTGFMNPANPAAKDKGNPLKNPYCIRWEHHPDEPEFGKKYKAIRMEGMELTDEISKLISETEPPDVSRLAEKMNQKTMRAILEHAALIDIPFDEIFDGLKEADETKPAQEQQPASSHAAKPASKPTPPPPPIAADEDLFECDNEKCKKPIKATDKKCPHCGFVYEVEAAAPPPPPPALKKRSQVSAGAAAAVMAPVIHEMERKANKAEKNGTGGRVPAAPPSSVRDVGASDDRSDADESVIDDEIPF